MRKSNRSEDLSVLEMTICTNLIKLCERATYQCVTPRDLIEIDLVRVDQVPELLIPDKGSRRTIFQLNSLEYKITARSVHHLDEIRGNALDFQLYSREKR